MWERLSAIYCRAPVIVVIDGSRSCGGWLWAGPNQCRASQSRDLQTELPAELNGVPTI
jgi:hypothetical protein